MLRHNHILFMSIQCNMSWLSRCIVGHPICVNRTSLSEGSYFHRSIKGAYNCIYFLVRPLLLSPRRWHLCAKKCFWALHPSLPSVGRPSVRLSFSFAIGRISSPTIAENNKLFGITTVNLNASLFDRQLNCHSDKWSIKSITRVSPPFWLQWKLQWELAKFLLGYWHKYFTTKKDRIASTVHCPFFEFKYF